MITIVKRAPNLGCHGVSKPIGLDVSIKLLAITL